MKWCGTLSCSGTKSLHPMFAPITPEGSSPHRRDAPIKHKMYDCRGLESKHDGPLGSLKATGRQMSLAFYEICHLDKQGRMVSGGCYYDEYTFLTHHRALP